MVVKGDRRGGDALRHETLKIGAGYIVDRKAGRLRPCSISNWKLLSEEMARLFQFDHKEKEKRRRKKEEEEEEEEEKGSSKLLDNIFPLESKANFLT
ncbi:hypothetical protein HZH68_007567 [Vespula germanica]|uniref:Uncharacterized protein n=1 Tax=Vespula germanica TaxID=30212 RepID=A0A834NA25_VESGE|nr:hypothetical protein HZH68_007567 [Vespula germanica]